MELDSTASISPNGQNTASPCLTTLAAYLATVNINPFFLIFLVMGKVEGSRDDDKKKDWHGHVTAVTVAPIARRQGIARYLMDYLEQVTHKQ